MGERAREIDASILDTVKDSVGLHHENVDFETRLVEAINAVFFILLQEGIIDEPYEISDQSDVWRDVPFNENTAPAINSVIEWFGARVRQMFDPPTSNVLATALADERNELEWRNFITNNYIGEIGDLYGDE